MFWQVPLAHAMSIQGYVNRLIWTTGSFHNDGVVCTIIYATSIIINNTFSLFIILCWLLFVIDINFITRLIHNIILCITIYLNPFASIMFNSLTLYIYGLPLNVYCTYYSYLWNICIVIEYDQCTIKYSLNSFMNLDIFVQKYC